MTQEEKEPKQENEAPEADAAAEKKDAPEAKEAPEAEAAAEKKDAPEAKEAPKAEEAAEEKDTPAEEGPKLDPNNPIDRAVLKVKDSLPQSVLLSDVVGGAPPNGPIAYVPSTIALRSEARATLHARAVADIAKERFAFPTERHPHFKTYVNVPGRSMGVEMSDGRVAYPDIVVVQHPENYTKILGHVETNETVREAVAAAEWLPFAELAPLYLYVPVGKADEALRLCRRLDIPIVGIRTWRYIVGYEEPEINDHYTVPSGPEEMLPKILRPG